MYAIRYNIGEIGNTFVGQFIGNFAAGIMEDIRIIKVRNRKQMDDFLNIVEVIYKDNRCYVPELYSDVKDVFNPRRNSAFSFCEVERFVAYAGGKCVGRVAGIINQRANKRWNVSCVRFGYLEFIDNFLVAEALMEAVEQWGRDNGMNMIQGPMRITDFDKEGMLVDGFEYKGSAIDIYNHPYYPTFMEAMNYRKAVDWLQMHVEVPQQLPEKYKRAARYVRERTGLQVRKMTLGEMKGEYGLRVFHLLNECYGHLFGFTPFTEEQMHEFIRKFIVLADPEMIPVVENPKGDIIGVAVTMHSLTEALQRTNGRLFPLGWWHLLKALKWKRSNHVDMLLIAVRPDYQGQGVNALFFDDLISIYQKRGIKRAETGPTLEENIMSLSQWKPFNPQIIKRRRCYTKELSSY